MDVEENCCWICLASDGELAHVCDCPTDRVVHRKCLARWQLQSAGKSEERFCRFCSAAYPSWKDSLTPPELTPAIPVVSVHYNGMCYRLKVRPGPEGLASFQKQLQCITGMSELDCMQITFQCRAPETCEELNFKGISAFDAAIHCASISAAERQRAVQTAKDIEAAQQQQQQCQHEFQSAQGSGQPQEQVSTSAASPASAVLPHRSHSSRVVPADPAAGQLASAHHLHHHQHQRHHSQHERRTTTAAAGLLGVHSQQVEEHSPSVADARVGEPQADPHSCPAQQRSGLRRMQDLLRSLFL